MDYETAREYEESCIQQHGTLTGKNLKKVRKVILILKKLKPEQINVIHLLMNKTRDAKRQKAMVAGREHILKNGCKNLPMI